MTKVLILDANQRSALAVTRSLGCRGIELITADDTPIALAGSSRYSQKYVQYASPTQESDQFIDSISGICSSDSVNILLPMTELTTQLLLQHRDRLPDVTLPFPDASTVDAVADKFSLMQTASRLGITIPSSWFVDDPDSMAIDLDNLSYPIVLKPGKSWQSSPSGWFRSTVRIAASPEEVHGYLKNDPGFQYERYLLQECVSGTGQGIFAIYNQGQPLAFFSHRRLREKPPWGGVSVLSESRPLDPRLLEPAKTLLDDAKWHGIAMVEFKVAEDGTPYLMEINTRFWGSLQLAVDAGVDFPYLLYQIAVGEQPQPVSDYQTGKKLRWLLGDIDSLYIAMKDSRSSLSQKIRHLAAFLTPSLLNTRHEVNRWNDIGPFKYELIKYVRDLRS